MNRTLCLLLSCLAGGLPACGDKGSVKPGGDAGPDVRAVDSAADSPAATDAGNAVVDGGAVDTVPSPLVQRGSYLVGSVLGCPGCHTSREMGAPMLAGVKCWRDTMPTVDGKGCVNTPNLTNHETGLRTRNDNQIKDLFRTGLRPDGKYLFSHMPAHLFANLTDADADAVVAYLRTVTGIDNMLPANEEPWMDTMRPTAPVLLPVKLDEPNAISTVPAGAANADSAGRGRYLAALTCIECHTKPLADPNANRAFDVNLVYQGGRSFMTGTATVYSVNLTPDATGLAGWNTGDIVKVLKMSLDRDGKRVCAPMRSYAGMTEGDATDIANYMLALPAKVNAIPMQCVMTPPPDGGASDVVSSDGGDGG